MNALPAWMTKAIVTAIIGALITGFSAWGALLTGRGANHETRITVVESKVDDVRSDIKEIKQDQKEILNELRKPTAKKFPPIYGR